MTLKLGISRLRIHTKANIYIQHESWLFQKAFYSKILSNQNKIKSNLYYTRLIPFQVSRVSGAHLCGFAPRPILSKLQRWWVVGNVWEISSARDLNTIPPALEANILSLVLEKVWSSITANFSYFAVIESL